MEVGDTFEQHGKKYRINSIGPDDRKRTLVIWAEELPQRSELEKLLSKHDSCPQIFGNGSDYTRQLSKEWWQDGVKIGAFALLEYLSKQPGCPTNECIGQYERARKWCGKS